MCKFFNKKVVIVTGATSGIGRETALKLIKKGAIVVGVGRNSKNMNYNCCWYKCDVSNEGEVKKTVAKVVKKFGRVDMLVNCAGFGVFETYSKKKFFDNVKEQMDVNFYGSLNFIKHVLPSMKKKKFGRIVNVSSIEGLRAFKASAGYAASKFAVTGFTQSLWHDLKGSGIKVSLVCPGYVKTHFFDKTKKIPSEVKAIPPISAKTVANSILFGLKSGSRLVISPWFEWIYVKLNGISLYLGDWLVNRWVLVGILVVVLLWIFRHWIFGI